MQGRKGIDVERGRVYIVPSPRCPNVSSTFIDTLTVDVHKPFFYPLHAHGLPTSENAVRVTRGELSSVSVVRSFIQGSTSCILNDTPSAPGHGNLMVSARLAASVSSKKPRDD